MKYEMEINRAVIRIDAATGIISGRTYPAKEEIKREFNAKWDSARKVWISTPADIANAFSKYHDSYVRVHKLHRVDADPEPVAAPAAEAPAEVVTAATARAAAQPEAKPFPAPSDDEVREAAKTIGIELTGSTLTAEQRQQKIERVRKELALAERQPRLYTADEVRRKIRDYRNAYLEGGEGYIPHFYTRSEYLRLKARLIALTTAC